MSKHLTPAVHASWLHRDTLRRCDCGCTFQFPARPVSQDISSFRIGACGDSSTGTGEYPHSLSLAAPHGEPVPVGHLTLIDRIRAAAEKLDDIEEDCA